MASSLDNPLLKGLLVGSSCGLIAGWFGMPPLRALILGAIVGILAGITKLTLTRNKQKKEAKANPEHKAE